MKHTGWIAGIFLAATFSVGSGANAAEDSLQGTLRNVIEKQTAAYDEEDAKGTMNTIHSKSPEYHTMEQALPGQFTALDLRAKVVEFRYLGHDDEFAVARVKVKTAGESGTEFAANIVDSIVLFHQENGVWKFWSDEILGVELVQ